MPSSDATTGGRVLVPSLIAVLDDYDVGSADCLRVLVAPTAGTLRASGRDDADALERVHVFLPSTT